MSGNQLLTKITRLEQAIASLKLEAYASLKKSVRRSLPYPETAITRAVKQTRQNRWRELYAKNVARIH